MKYKLIAFLLVICFLFSSCNLFNTYEDEKNKINIDSENEFRAIWLNYNELCSIINSSENSSELEKNIKNIVNNCKSSGLNRIILHVRAFGDSYYNSEIFPVNECMSDKLKSDKKYDPLEIFCRIAHIENFKIDAWINPYRISYSDDTDKLPENSLVKKMLDSDNSGQDVVVFEQGIFLNPASQKAQGLILSGVREILEKYDVDGIHIDDYFYPTTDSAFDKISFEAYTENNGKLELAQWRRENVNSLVSQIYSAVKAYSESVSFSISPGGNIDSVENECYADVKLWCSQSGYADFIIPQIYYGFENEKMPFESVVNSWTEIADKTKVKLCFGLACYKCGNADEYAGVGINEWIDGFDIVSRQIVTLRGLEDYCGFCIYSYSSLFDAKNDENSNLQLHNIKNVLLY